MVQVPAKVLVTGATGFLGQHVVAQLQAMGQPVRALVHRRPADRLPPDIETVAGDVRDRVALERACQGVRYVVHLAAIIRERGDETYQAVNVEGTQNVLEAASAAGVAHVVHMSVIGARPDPRYGYLFSRWQAEELVRASGLPFTVLRASYLIGPSSALVERLLTFLRPPFAVVYPIAGSGRARSQPLAVDDMARCIAATVGQDRFFGQTIELGGPEVVTLEQLIDLVLELRGARRFKLRLPLALVRPGSWLLERARLPTPATTEELAMLEMDNVAEPDSVERTFGFRPKTLRETLSFLEKAD